MFKNIRNQFKIYKFINIIMNRNEIQELSYELGRLAYSQHITVADI